MDWTPGGMSSDVEDRRGDSGGGGGFGFGGGGLGIVGVLVLLIVSLLTGRNYIGAYLSGGGGSGGQTQSRQSSDRSAQYGPQQGAGGGEASATADRDAQLVSFTLDDVQKTWAKIFADKGQTYQRAKLVLFRGRTYSGCGTAQAATGPFYCPADGKVYIDLGFWDELKQLGGDTGDFAQSYVIAHELGHHVQDLLGTEAKVQRLQQQNPDAAKKLSVDLELQADCYAGVWGHSTEQRGIVHEDDVDGALKAAAAVGDDHIQKVSGRAVSPESWTHGSSASREAWFKKGLSTGNPGACNTFASGSQE